MADLEVYYPYIILETGEDVISHVAMLISFTTLRKVFYENIYSRTL